MSNSRAIIPENVSILFPSNVNNILSSYDQESIDRMSNLITDINNITDNKGSTFSSARTGIYGQFLNSMIGFITFIVFKEKFIRDFIRVVGQIPDLQMNLINVLTTYKSDDEVIEFYTTLLNSLETLPRTIEGSLGQATFIAKRIINQTTSTIPTTNNSSPELTAQEALEKDLQYLFGLGLTPESGNETLIDRLARYKELTGEDYVYNPPSSGGRRRRKARKTKTLKRKMRKVRKSRKSRK